MALPGSVSTATINFGPYTDASGAIALVGVKAKLFPVDPATGKRLNLVHVATGQEILPADLTVTIGSDGTASVGPVPHTDNAGLSTVGFAYRVEWRLLTGPRIASPGNKTFAVPTAAGATVDFDLLDVADAVPGVLVPMQTTPTGGAGGALSGSYPNPGLNETAVENIVVASAAVRAAAGSVAATVTASGALVAQKHNPVDATGGTKTMTLPTGQLPGSTVSVEKTDASANLVSITGSIRGVAAQTISLAWSRETVGFRADAAGSWWPISGHKTKTSLDTAYGDTGVAALLNSQTSATRAAVKSAVSAPGIYVPANWGQFWRPKRDAASAGSPAVVAVDGDSIAQGYYSSDLRAKGFIGLMRAAMQTQYGDGGSGFEGTRNSPIAQPTITGYPGTDSAWWTTTGTWADPATKAGPAASTINSAVVGSTATKTFRGTILDIFYLTGTATSFTYSIDGAAAVTVNVGTSQNTAVTTVTGLSAGAHTVVLTVTTAANFFLAGITGRNASGVRVDMFGQAGHTSDIFYQPSATFGVPSKWAGGPSNPSPADLLIYGMGANDVSNNITGDAFAAGAAYLMNTLKNGAGKLGAVDILIYLPVLNIGTWGNGRILLQDYATRLRGIAEMYGAAFIDFHSLYRASWAYFDSLGLMSTGAGNSGGVGHDGAHPGDAGHADYWAKLQAALPQLLG